MRIIEVRDGFVKIESAENLALSSFVEIKDSIKSYIAQIQQVKKAGDYTIAYAKCIFLYDGDLVNYDKTLPNINSEIRIFNYEDLRNSFEYKKPIIVGSFIDNDLPISIEEEYLNKKTLINIETKENINIVLKNLAKQFKNAIIIDTAGIIDGEKFIAGVDFKLPLNTAALEFMFEDCLNDATSESKNLIKEIFQDLADYSRTVPFLPFGTLKTIVDDMVDKSHIFKLLVLKNKLAKFEQLGYFAKTFEEAENLKKILAKQNTVIDLSKLDQTFLNRYLSIIYSTIETSEIKPQVFVYATNNLNKKNLKTILTGEVSSTFATHSRFKYINEIKPMFSNFIIEPNFANNENFKKVSSLLPLIKKDCCLVIGEGTNFIPLVSNIKNYIIKQAKSDNLTETTEIDKTEEALNNDSIIIEEPAQTEDCTDDFNIEKNEAIIAIDKKSEELIEKVSEEILTEEMSFKNDIFTDEEQQQEEDLENTELDLNAEEDLTQKENFTNLSDYNNYHTEVDETKIIEISEDVSMIMEDNTELEEMIEDNISSQETLEFVEDELISENLSELDNISEINETEKVNESEIIEIETDLDDIITMDSLDEATLTAETALESTLDNNPENDNDTTKEKLEVSNNITNDDNIAEISSIEPLEADNDLANIEDFIELEDSEISEDMIIVDIDDENDVTEEDLDKAIIKDVDKVFTTIKEDSISDSDLDFIDELNNSVNENTEENTLSLDNVEELDGYIEQEEEDETFLQPLEEVNDFAELDNSNEILETRNSSTPMVPVYNADIPSEDIVMSDALEQGDTVYHAKYGNGVVEKMIKYGAKSLYSINFDNVGRRLLDPTLTEIKKA